MNEDKTNSSQSRFFELMGLPSLFWLIFFVVVPSFIVLSVSFMQKGTYGGIVWQFSLKNYQDMFQPQILSIFLKSLVLSLTTTIACLVIGIFVAWSMSTAPSAQRHFYVVAIALPFLTNLIIRIYAIRVFVGIDGPLQWLLQNLQFEYDPFAISQNQYLVYYGMLTTYLPFMVLPLFGAFEKLDFSMVEAAMDLGANQWEILTKVIIPQLKKPMMFGATLVFVPAFGEYLLPDLLGGAKNMYVGNLITMEFLKARNWPMGAAIAVVMMGVLFLFLFLLQILVRDKEWKK